jgi:hypothetical protein
MHQEKLSTKVDFSQIGEAINHDLASKMVKNFNDANPNEPFGFNVGRNIIDQILAQPGCAGLRIYKAINEEGSQTLVYAGVDRNGNTIVEYPGVDSDGKLGKVEALIGDKTDTSTYNWFR